ncbi:MAG: acyltransferase family protein [Candidatus Shapirobacteria bacterium]
MSEIDKVDKYNYAIDLLRIVSIISVVLIHISTKTLELVKYDFSNNFFTLYINQATRFTVPLFFFISAFVLELSSPPNLSFISYIKKRFSKILLPYIFWSAIYQYLVYPNYNGNFLKSLVSGGASYQLYFIPSLFLLYLFFPLVHRYYYFFVKKQSILFFGLIQIVLLANDYYFKPLNLPQPIGVFILNLDTFILGVIASHYQQEIRDYVKKHLISLTITTVIISILITAEAWILYRLTKNYLTFYSNWRPMGFIYTLYIGSLFFYLFDKVKTNLNLIKTIASYSFFVFFVHIVFIEIIWKLLPTSTLVYFLIPFILVIIPSYLLAFLVSKIPYLSRLTG